MTLTATYQFAETLIVFGSCWGAIENIFHPENQPYTNFPAEHLTCSNQNKVRAAHMGHSHITQIVLAPPAERQWSFII